MRFYKICVLGLGYIGLPTACMFATHGVKVTGVDTNQKIVDGLRNGELHIIYEPGLRSLVQAALKSGNLAIGSEPEEADAFIIAVPTPFHADKRANLDYVTSAAASIVPSLRRHNLVILESTSPPRTTIDILAPILERSGLKAGDDFCLAYSPERVLPGKILQELVENARVIGGINSASADAGRDLYAAFVRGEIILTDATTAEMVKLMENTYRDINIAIANEFSRLAEHNKIDVWEAIRLANRHPRVNILSPGPGVGGHCISVDPWFLVESAPELATLTRTAREVNDSQPRFVLNIIQKALNGDISGKRIAVLGLTYKADVDDMRESPAVEIAHLLQSAGVSVSAYEPSKSVGYFEDIPLAPSLETALDEVDALVLLVGHTVFRQLEPQQVARLTKARIAIDIVNAWDVEAWQNAGFQIKRLGVG